MGDRKKARELAAEYLGRNQPLGWFEVLYQTSEGDEGSIPWADMCVNPNLKGCEAEIKPLGEGSSALVVGSGLGDDAEYLAELGYRVIAFDISKTAVEWCRRRFPGSSVEYVEADLLSLPPEWERGFDFVFEAYTLQVLPEGLRREGVRALARLPGPEGRLLVIARGRDREEDPGAMPWPLLRSEIEEFSTLGLEEVRIEDYVEEEVPPVRRFRGMFRYRVAQ